MSESQAPTTAGLTPAQIQTREKIENGSRHGVGGPAEAWSHSPTLFNAVNGLGGFFRTPDNHLNKRLTELAIIITARARTAQIEWYAHVPRARKSGISREIVSAIAMRETPVFEHQDEAIVYRFSQELNQDFSVSDETFDQAVSILGSKAVVDLTALVGFYNMVAMTLKTYQLQPPTDATRLLPE